LRSWLREAEAQAADLVIIASAPNADAASLATAIGGTSQLMKKEGGAAGSFIIRHGLAGGGIGQALRSVLSRAARDSAL
jgi:hypothetical protein